MEPVDWRNSLEEIRLLCFYQVALTVGRGSKFSWWELAGGWMWRKTDRHHVAIKGLEWRYPERGVSKTDRMGQVGMDHWYPEWRSSSPTSPLEQRSLEHHPELCSDCFCVSPGEETHSLSGQPLCFPEVWNVTWFFLVVSVMEELKYFSELL